jgi:uncharacterized protein YqeY
MILKNKINEDYMVAFKNKQSTAKTVLSVIKGEIQTQEKKDNVQHLSDDNVLKILNKMVKSLKETLSGLSKMSGREELLQQTKDELSIMENYLPKELTADEINEKLDAVIASGANNIGMIMKEFANLPVDKKMVSELVKTKLNK